jgi:hypothetical protein
MKVGHCGVSGQTRIVRRVGELLGRCVVSDIQGTGAFAVVRGHFLSRLQVRFELNHLPEAIEVTDSNAASESAAQLIENRALFIPLLLLFLI